MAGKRFAILHPRSAILALVLLLRACEYAPATPFVQTFYNSDGTPQTNAITMVAYPAQNTWIVVGTNLYYGGSNLTLQPTTNGYVSNAVSPGGYRLTFANTTLPLYVNILNTTNVLPLSTYVTNAPVIAGSYLSAYGVLTNMLGYAPATNTALGVKAALGYTPPTNSLASLTNAFGFLPLSSSATISAALLPQLGSVGVTNLNGTMLTNLGTGTIICWTNLAIGVAPTLGAPDGSLLITTNGVVFTRTNAAWVNLK